MEESPVLIILDKMTFLLQEELNLLKGVRTEVEFINDELEQLKAISMAAEDTLEDKDDPELKVWMKQVTDVSHHVQDVFDKFTTRPVNYLKHGHDSPCKRFASAIQALRARYWIASDVQEIKGRLEIISNDRLRITETGSSSSHVDRTKLDDLQGDELLVEEADLVGTEKPLCAN